MGSAPGDTTIRKFGKQHSGTKFKTINSPVFTCSTFQTNCSNSPKGNQSKFPEDVVGPQMKIINKHLEKSVNTTMGYLHMIIQGLQLTKEKHPGTDLEEKIKTNVVFCTTVEPSTTK